MEEEVFSKYERARILGARALQISMDAPILIKMEEEKLSALNFDPLRIAEDEFNSGILPISVKRPLPQKKEEEIESIVIEEEKKSDAEKIKKEQIEEKEIEEDSEIMGIATPEDEKESEVEKPAEVEI